MRDYQASFFFFPPPPPPLYFFLFLSIARRVASSAMKSIAIAQCSWLQKQPAGGVSPVATEIRGNSARFYRKAVVLISARPKIADEANERWFVAVTFGKLPCPPPSSNLSSPISPPRLFIPPSHPVPTGIFNFVHKSVMEESLRVPVDRNEAPARVTMRAIKNLADGATENHGLHFALDVVYAPRVFASKHTKSCRRSYYLPVFRSIHRWILFKKIIDA